MTLRTKLYGTLFLVHGGLFALALSMHERLDYWLLAIEAVLLASLFILFRLLGKALQPLAYIETFSNLLTEEEFSIRFSRLKQQELDLLIDQFNLMLTRLQQERLAIGEQKGVFEKLMAESPIGVVLLDFNRRVSDINASAEHLLQIDRARVEGKSLEQVQDSELKYLKGVEGNSHKLVIAEQGRRLKVGHYNIRDRGFTRSFYLIYEMTGDIIQSQKSAYDKLIRLMSHEVNNTIAITNSLLESCLTFKHQLNPDTRQDFEQAINIVINRSGSLNQFMQGYADVVKLASPIKTQFNLTKLIKDLTTLFFARCDELGIHIRFIETQEVYIHADVNLIEQALINVLKNAIDAIGQDGEIKISLSSRDGEVRLEIKDDGEGLSSEVEQQLFTPFFTSKESGQGVGLMLIREVLNLHDYSFALANNDDGVGASFTLTMPCELV